MFENVFNAMTGRQKVKYDQIFICGMIDNNLPCCFVKFILANISISTNASKEIISGGTFAPKK